MEEASNMSSNDKSRFHCVFFKSQLGIVFKVQPDLRSIVVIGSTHTKQTTSAIERNERQSHLNSDNESESQVNFAKGIENLAQIDDTDKNLLDLLPMESVAKVDDSNVPV